MKRKKQTIGRLVGGDVNAFEWIDPKTLKPLKKQPHRPKPAQEPTLEPAIIDPLERQAWRARLEQARTPPRVPTAADREADARLAKSTKRLEALERQQWRERAEAVQKAAQERREREAEKRRLEFRQKVETARREAAVEKELAEIKAQELEYLRRESRATSAERIRKKEQQEFEARRERLRAAHASYLARNPKKPAGKK
jgi:hypothetical protein